MGRYEAGRSADGDELAQLAAEVKTIRDMMAAAYEDVPAQVAMTMRSLAGVLDRVAKQ